MHSLPGAKTSGLLKNKRDINRSPLALCLLCARYIGGMTISWICALNKREHRLHLHNALQSTDYKTGHIAVLFLFKLFDFEIPPLHHLNVYFREEKEHKVASEHILYLVHHSLM